MSVRALRLRRRSILSAAVVGAFFSGMPARADLQWDPAISGGATPGGSGIWDNSTNNWFDSGNDVNVSWDQTVGVFGGAAGTYTVTIAPGGVSADGLTFNTAGYTIAGAAADTITLTGGATITNNVNANITATLAGTAGLTVTGPGALTLGANNSGLSGPVSINGGTVLLGNGGALGAGAVTMAGGTTLASSSATAVTLTNAVTAGGDFTLGQATGGTGVITLGSLDLGGATPRTITVNTGGAAITGAVNNGDLTKAGVGTLTLNAASTRTGPTIINAGKLTANNLTAVGTGLVTVNTGGTYELNVGVNNLSQSINLTGGTFQWTQAAQLSLLAAGPTINIGTGGGTVNVGGAATTGKVLVNAGLLTGTGTLTKTGGGDLQLAGANTGFSGGVTMQAGVLELQNTQSLGTTPPTITLSGGELVASNLTWGGNINVSGGTISGNNGNSTYSGNIASSGNFTFGVRDFQATGTSRTLTLTGALSGTGIATAGGGTAAGGVLNLNGSLTGFNGTIAAGTNAIVNVNSKPGASAHLAAAGGTVNIRYSTLSSQPPANIGANGLNAFYYNESSNIGTGAVGFATDQFYLNPRVFSRVDPFVNIVNAGAGDLPIQAVPGYAIQAGGAINSAVMWKGLLNVTTAGSYQFSGTDDDNLLVIIDGVQVGAIGVQSANTNIGTAVNLTAGYHNICVKHTQGTGGGYTTLSYSGPDTSSATVLVGSVANSLKTGSLDPISLGGIDVSATGTVDIPQDVTASGIAFSATSQLNVTASIGNISDLTVTGASTLFGGGTSTLNNTAGRLIFNGAIGQTAANGALTIAATAGQIQFNAVNTYNGVTTVSGGQLLLNATGGNSIAGNLTVSAANANGLIKNVILQQPNQIADTATVTLSGQGILDLGGNAETVAALAMTGGYLMNGTLTANNTSITLGSGTINANLAGNFSAAGGLTKNTTGTLWMTGNNSYAGQTLVTAGLLRASAPTALGATGAGNGTVVSSGATLELLAAGTTSETVTLSGAGVSLQGVSLGGLRNAGGDSALASVTLAAAATVEGSSGNLAINSFNAAGNALTLQGQGSVILGSAIQNAGTITKNGAGALVFGYDTAGSFPAATWNAGTLGFAGTQSLGSATVGTTGYANATTWQFNSDPGAGTSVNVNGNKVIANFAADQLFLNRLSGGGVLALGANNANDLSFAGAPNLSLGAAGFVTYSGNLTPGSNGFNLGGAAGTAAGPTGFGTGQLIVTSTVAGTGAMNVTGDVRLMGANTFTGAVNIGAGGVLRSLYNDALGNTANAVNLTNGGTLQILMTSGNAGQIYTPNGTQVGPNQANRVINIGTGGGTIDVAALSNGNNLFALYGTNALTGTGNLTKSGLGFMALVGASNYSGNLTVASNGGLFDIRGDGTLLNITSIAVNSGAQLNVDDQNGLGIGRQSGYAGKFIADRVRDTAPITLTGGTVLFTARGAAASNIETFGPITLSGGQSGISGTSNASGTIGGVLKFNNANLGGATPSLTRVTGATIAFGAVGTPGTFGAGAAASVDTPGASNTQVQFLGMSAASILPYASIGNVDLAAYGVPGAGAALNQHGIYITPYTAQAAAAFTPVAANVYNLNAAGTATLNGGNSEMLGLRFGSGNNVQVLAFSNVTDKLAINSGAIIHDNNNQNRDIGTTVNTAAAPGTPGVQGILTAGPLTGNGSARELFLHSTNGNLRVFSIVQDNNGFPVTVVKDLAGTATLQPTFNLAGANATNASAVITTANTAGLSIGQQVTGVGINGFITAINPGVSFTLNANATATNTGLNLAISTPNLFTGGVFVNRGQLTAIGMGSLGAVLSTNTPSAVVRGGTLSVNATGGFTGTVPGGYTGPVYTTADNGEIILGAGTGSFAGIYTSNTDRFSISSGSVIFGSGTNSAGAGLNSLTRISSPTAFTAGGQVYLAPDAIVRHLMSNAPDQGTGTLTIQNLGTNADLYFSPGNTGALDLVTLTVGQGTPWKGISSERGGTTWGNGTIYANSDFYLQGLVHEGAIQNLTLGGNAIAGTYSIVNNAGKPINAYVIGGVQLDEDSPVKMPAGPNSLTFVVTPGSIFQPNRTNALGDTSLGGTAKVLVQAGATLDPGNYVPLGAAANQTLSLNGAANGLQNLPYPLASPLNNSPVTVEAGGRFLINDASGIGSATPGNWLMKTGSVLDLGNANAFFGRGAYGLNPNAPVDTTGVIQAGQFVYEPGVIVRLSVDNIYKISQFVSGETNGDRAILEVVGGTRFLTNQTNPFVAAAPGTVLVAPETVTLGNGGMLTNDSNDRQLSEGRGRLVLNSGAVLAATTQTFLNIQEGFDVAAGANLTIGSPRTIDGVTKLGTVQLLGPNSNTFGANTTTTVVDGAELEFTGANVWGDNAAINLSTPVTQFPSTGAIATQPGNGAALLLNTATFAEVVGQLTGNGTVFANQAGTYVVTNSATDFPSSVIIKSTNGQNPSLGKIGIGTMTLTSSSDSTGDVTINQGGITVAGNSTNAFTFWRLGKGGTLTLDNNGTPINNRLGNVGKGIAPAGGTFNLKGNDSTPVTEQFANFANSNGNSGPYVNNAMLTFVNVTPGAATTTLVPTTLEAINGGGVANQRSGTYVLRSPTMGNVPGTYNVAGNYTFAGSRISNGLIIPTNPNFLNNGAVSNAAGPLLVAAEGSGVMPTRGDYLADANPTGLGTTFATLSGMLTNGVTPVTAVAGVGTGATTNANATITVTSTTGLTTGMGISGANIPYGATITSITNGTQFVISANATATVAGTALTFYTPSTTLNLPSTAGLSPFMPVSGTGIPAGTIITAVGGSSVTLSNNAVVTNATNPGLFVAVGTGMRGLADSEYINTIRSNLTESTNVKLSGAATITGDARVQTLTTTPGTTLTISGVRPLDTSPSRFLLNAGGLMTQAGGTTTINGTANTFLQTPTGTSLFLHTFGDLNLNATVFTDQAVVKTQTGTLNVGPGAFSAFRGSLQIDGGVVNLGANNTFATIRGQNGFTTNNNLFLNAGTLNLNGNSEVVNTLNSSNPLPGMGGNVSSNAAATLTVQGGGNFSGSIGGAISLDKINTNTLLLTNANPYSGSTTIRSGTVQLRDSGTLASTSNVDVYYSSTLTIDDSYLTGGSTNRVNPAAPFNIRGGNLQVTGGAGQLTSQTFNNVNLLAGRFDFNNNAGGSGAIEVNIGNLTRAAGTGSTISINQGYGFVGTGGNNTTAIRYFINNGTFNGNATTSMTSIVNANNGIIGGWAIFNGDTFLTYQSTTGVGGLGNTADGYRNYESTNAQTATGTQNVNDGTSRTFAANSALNSWRIAPNAANTQTINAGVTLTFTSGGLITNNNNTTTFASGGAGAQITSGTNEMDVWVQQNTTTFNVPVVGSLDLVKSGAGALTLGAVNTYTGKTFVNGGTLNLGATGQSVPGDLFIQNGTATETVASQLATNANIFITGGGRFNAFSGSAVSETIGSITATDLSGTSTTTVSILDRTAAQVGGTVNFSRGSASGAAISTTNTNPQMTPFVGAFVGNLGFTPPAGQSSILQVNGPVATGVNNANGLNTVGLRLDAAIAAVPAGITDGGLVKQGTGQLVLSPGNTVSSASSTTTVGSNVVTSANTTGLVVGMPVTGTGIITGSVITAISPGVSYTLSAPATAAGTVTVTAQPLNFNTIGLTNNGTTSTQTAQFNIAQGVVRFDTNGALGSPSTLTTVQNGAVLLGSNATGVAEVGSLNLKDGSSLGVTINSAGFGAVSNSPLTQSVMTIGSGTSGVTFYANDFFVQSTNAGTITVNSHLTGSGNINMVGPQITGAVGIVNLSNPITRAFQAAGVAGSNDYSGTITIGTNTQLVNLPNKLSNAGATGSALGDANIVLAGGRLSIRDDASTAANITTAGTLTYGNPVTLTANSFLDGNRANGSTTTQTIALGALNVAAGTSSLTVDSGNSYVVSFSSIDGPGTMVKAGGSSLVLNSIAGSFAGGIRIAGPQGIAVARTFNTLTLPSTATLPNFGVDGSYHTAASANLTISGTLDVGNNAGQVLNSLIPSATTGSNVGALLVTNTTTLRPAILKNNGIIGSGGGLSTLQAPGTGTMNIMGQGLYQTAGTGTNSVPAAGPGLTLNGTLVDDGTAPTRFKVAGNSALDAPITLNAASSTNTGGAEVQSGILQVNGGSNPLGVPTALNPIRVLGYPTATTAAATGPVNVPSPTLQFANTVSQTGNVQNSGLVQVVAGGATSIGGRIVGPGTGAVIPGLLEGQIGNGGNAYDNAVASATTGTARVANNGAFGVKLEPRMAQAGAVTGNPITGWDNNHQWVYTGQFFDADGKFSIAASMDDRVAVWIDGKQVLVGNMGGTNGLGISSAYKASINGTIANVGNDAGIFDFSGLGGAAVGLPANWHTIEVRLGNGTGGAGPLAGNGFAANFGLGINPDGATAVSGSEYYRPVDPGDGSLFRTALAPKGDINVQNNANLSVDGFNNVRTLTMGTIATGGAAVNAVLTVTNAISNAASDVDLVAVSTNASAFGVVNLASGAVVNVGTSITAADVMTIPTGKTLQLTGGGVMRVGSATATMLAAGNMLVDGGTAVINTNGGAAGGTINARTGGTVGGIGSIAATLQTTSSGTGSAANGHIAPGELGTAGHLATTGTVTLADNTFLDYNFGAPNGGNSDPAGDLLIVDNSGLLTLGNGMTVNSLTPTLTPGRYEVISYATSGDIAPTEDAKLSTWTLAFNGTPAGVSGTDYTFQSDGNDVYLNVINPVPEPATIGLAALAGFGLLARRRRRRA